MTVFLYIVTIVTITAIYPLTMWLLMRSAYRGKRPGAPPRQDLLEAVPSSRGPHLYH